MGKGFDWGDVPHGMAVYCEGLRLQQVEPLSEDESRAANWSISRKMARAHRWADPSLP